MTTQPRALRVTEPAASDRPPVVVTTTTSDAIQPATEAGERASHAAKATPIVGTIRPADSLGRQEVEVNVDGWRFDLRVEDDARADLRERATRDRQAGVAGGGELEIRAIIPGRIVSVAVAPGDTVMAAQALLVVEAMKMQNDLGSPRAGVVRRVAVGPGSTVDAGDVLVVLE
jgi:biotin carboxyl carrier protein